MVLGNDTDSEPISKLVTSHIGNGVISRVHGQELTYTLPLDSVEKFPGELQLSNPMISKFSFVRITF